MDSRDREAIEDLFERIARVEQRSGPRDRGAEALINAKIGQQPAAPYYMAQTILMQEKALNDAQARIEELEGRGDGAGARRSNAGPWDNAPGYGGGGFLAGAAQTAMGVAGGVLLGNMLADWLTPDQAAAQDAADRCGFFGRCGRRRRYGCRRCRRFRRLRYRRFLAACGVTPPPAPPARGRGAARDAIERALQDEGRRGGVDLFGALLARHVGLDHRALGRGGRKPLVPQHDGQVGQRGEVAQEGARRLSARTFGAVHVDRQAEDQAADLFARAEREQRLGVLGEFRAADRVEAAWRSSAPDRRARCRSSWCRGRARRGACPAEAVRQASSIEISGPGCCHLPAF